MRVSTQLVVVSVCGLLVAGCDKKAEDGAGSAEDRATKAAEMAKDPEKLAKAIQKDGPLAAATAKTGGGKLDCNVLIPASVRKEHMEGTALKAGSMVDRTLMCSADGYKYHVVYDCRRTTTLAKFEKGREKAKAEGSETADVAGVGRVAYGGADAVHFYDDDADCSVTVQGSGAPEIARALSKVLTAELLPALPKGKYVLDCEKLLPAALRKAHVGDVDMEADSIMVDTMDCKLDVPDGIPVSVNYGCRNQIDADFIGQMKAGFEKQKMKSEDVAIGKAGLYTEIYGTHSIVFADPDTGCMVTLSQQGDKAKALTFAKEIEKALTADSAK